MPELVCWWCREDVRCLDANVLHLGIIIKYTPNQAVTSVPTMRPHRMHSVSETMTSSRARQLQNKDGADVCNVPGEITVLFGDAYEQYGRFCGSACKNAFKHAFPNPLFENDTHLFQTMLNRMGIHSPNVLAIAPHYIQLQRCGGSMSIAEFRSNSIVLTIQQMQEQTFNCVESGIDNWDI